MKVFASFSLALVAFISAIALSGQGVAQDSMPPAPYAYQQLDDPAQEKQALELMQTLRCLTCQSQSIADSDAPMAGDLRHEVRTRIKAGEDPEAIRAWLIERYGDWVSYDPQISQSTWPLWVAPILFLLLAVFLMRGRFGRADDLDDSDAKDEGEAI